MRVAVTGGAGYIGSVVVEVLLREGHDVLVLDNLSKGHRAAVIEPAEFEQIALLNGEGMRAVFRDFRCEAVIHMAAGLPGGRIGGEPGEVLPQ